MSKYIIVLIVLTVFTLNVKSQIYTEIGSGYAFSTQKSKIVFNDNNSEFSKYSNVFSGVFYKGLLGFKFKRNIFLEIECEYNPNPTLKNILNNPNTIIVSDRTSFYKGSFLTIIPRVTYQLKIKNFIASAGIGISTNIINSYNYTFQNNYYVSYNSYHEIVGSYKEQNKFLFKIVEIKSMLNINIKFNYIVNKNISFFIEANTNSRFNLSYFFKTKLFYEKNRTETFDINNNPNLTIVESERNNIIQKNVWETTYYSPMLYYLSDISKLIYTQIGFHYTFNKKEKK